LRFRFFVAFGFALLLSSLAFAGVRAADSAASSTAADFITLLSFVGGTPLTEPERQRVETETESQLRSDPAGVASSEAKVRKFLASLPRAEAWERASQRESMRYQFELLPAGEPARQIVERHDPTVLFDQANKRLITEGTLGAWQRACVWMTNFLSVPAPGPDFIAAQRAEVKAHFASLPSDKQEAIAHVERDFPDGVLLLDRADSEKREAFISKARPEALDPQKLGIRVADAMAKAYDIALQREIINSSILLNAGFNYNGLYHAGMTHI
jgi:hypothetical protein